MLSNKTIGADSYLIGLTGWPHFSRDEIRCVFLALKKKESDSLSIGLTGWSHFSRDEIRCVFPTLKKYGVKFPVFHAPWPPCLSQFLPQISGILITRGEKDNCQVILLS